MSEPWFARRHFATNASTISMIQVIGEHEEEVEQHVLQLSLANGESWQSFRTELIGSTNPYPNDLRALSTLGNASQLIVIDQYGHVFDVVSGSEITAFNTHDPTRYLDAKIMARYGDANLVVGSDDSFYLYSGADQWRYIGGSYLGLFPKAPIVGHDVYTNPAFNFWHGIGAGTGSDVVIAGGRGRILRWDGQRFSDHSYQSSSVSEAEMTFTSVARTVSCDVYVAGYDSMRARGPSLIVKQETGGRFQKVFESHDGYAFFSLAEYQGRILVADFSQTKQGVYALADGELTPFLPDEHRDFRGASYIAAFDDALWVAGPKEILRHSSGGWQRFSIPSDF